MKLVMVITGSLRAAFTPYWINWIRMSRPDIELRLVRTRAARAFVTRPTLQQLVSGAIDDDEWDAEATGPALHIELAMWADAVLVWPATLDYIGRVARGEGDSPSLLMIACSEIPVAIAPALPPGGMEGRTYKRHVMDIERLPGIHIVPPTPAISAATRMMSAYGSAPMPDCLEALEKMLAESQPSEAASDGTDGRVVPMEDHR